MMPERFSARMYDNSSFLLTDLTDKGRFFYDLLQCAPEDCGAVQAQLARDYPVMDADDYMVWLLKITNPFGSEQHTYRDLYGVLAKVRSPEFNHVLLPTEHGLAMVFGLIHIEPDISRHANYIGNRTDFFDRQRWFAQDLMDEAQAQLGIALKCFLGRPIRGLPGIAQSYREMVDISDYSRAFGLGDRIVMYRDYTNLSESFPDRTSIVYMLSAYNRSFAAGKYRAALKQLEQLFDACFVKSAPSLELNHVLVSIIIGSVMTTYYTCVPEPDTRHLLWLFRSVDSLSNNENQQFSLENFMDCMREMIEELSMRSSPEPQSDEFSWLSELEHYIDHHYTDSNLSLSMLAEEFEISSSYLSHVFREKYGRSPMDYVSEKRVAMAKQLLAGGVTSTEAARRSGFSSERTLRHAFEKYENMLPSRFREQQAQPPAR